MLPQRLDMLFAFKAFSLAADLTVTQKRVAAGILDHFNGKTTQCDPSLDTLAILLGIDRRTVIRAVNRLVRLQYFRRIRHGGNFHRNFYEPLWPRFRAVEAEWKNRRRVHSQRFCEAKMSHWKGQPEHSAGGSDVTQTSPTNISNETPSNGSITKDLQGQKSSHDSQALASARQCSSIPQPKSKMFQVKETRPCDAARSAAERRWNTALQDQYLATPEVYSAIVDAIDCAMQAAATEAEMQSRGEGVRYILNQLKAQNVRLSVPGDVIAQDADHKKII